MQQYPHAVTGTFDQQPPPQAFATGPSFPPTFSDAHRFYGGGGGGSHVPATKDDDGGNPKTTTKDGAAAPEAASADGAVSSCWRTVALFSSLLAVAFIGALAGVLVTKKTDTVAAPSGGTSDTFPVTARWNITVVSGNASATSVIIVGTQDAAITSAATTVILSGGAVLPIGGDHSGATGNYTDAAFWAHDRAVLDTAASMTAVDQTPLPAGKTVSSVNFFLRENHASAPSCRFYFGFFTLVSGTTARFKLEKIFGSNVNIQSLTSKRAYKVVTSPAVVIQSDWLLGWWYTGCDNTPSASYNGVIPLSFSDTPYRAAVWIVSTSVPSGVGGTVDACCGTAWTLGSESWTQPPRMYSAGVEVVN